MGKEISFVIYKLKKTKNNIKSEIWGQPSGGYPVGRKGSGIGVEVAGFCGREISGLKGRRKRRKAMSEKCN